MKPSSILRNTAHRTWPVPRGPWVMRQTWRELLFAHWPVEPDTLRPRIPPGLTLDTYQGHAWIGIVPFRMTDIRVRGMLPIPTATHLPEINVRTYVVAQEKPGVLFFSLDAGSLLAVLTARMAFLLPYYGARFTLKRQGTVIHYESHRPRTKAPPVEFVADYWPVGPVFEPRLGSLEDWLTARYCLYTSGRSGRLYRGDIHHVPWPLQMAQADIARNTMASGQGLALPDTPPLLHYAHRMDMLAWPVAPLE